MTLLLGALLLAAVQGRWLERADFWFYDTSVMFSGRVQSPDILILAVDEPSLARLGRWPWSRRVMADVVDRLTQAGAGPVLLDVIFSEPERDDPLADKQLARALEKHGRVVLPVFIPIQGGAAVQPLPALAAVAHLGHAQALVDSDGASRRYMSIEAAGEGSFPYVGQVLFELSGAPSTLAVARPAAALLVPFAGPTGHFDHRSVVDLLTGRIAAQDIKGRSVLLGATAVGLGDNLVTPLAGRNGTMPGVEFVANVLAGLQASIAPRAVDDGMQVTLSLLLLLTLMTALLVISPQAALWVTLLACAGAAGASLLVLKFWGVWWSPAAPIAVMALAYPLWSWRRLEASLSAMTRETERIATLFQHNRPLTKTIDAGSFFDPVETRIEAITSAVDQIARELVIDNSTLEAHQNRDEMMRHLAHDLRSPLLSLRALADGLEGDRRAENVALLQRIDECARRALDLAEQFLLMGRAESLDIAYLGEADLVQILHQAADDLWEDGNRQGARVERRCALDCAVVRGDTRLLHRTLLNLGWNALRHGPSGGTVTLSLEETVEGFVLRVHDQGTGFPPETMKLMSQRYTQATPASPGHGLGLALAQLVASKHQATLWAELPEEGGFSVVFWLPRQ